ncbi:MAG: AtpZ/AtpI family protein [Proteobacteria bacterium]|nr:AtpZ/AtpI family protein [Pseudomonadota bacterium]
MKKLFDLRKNRAWARDATIVTQLGLTMAGCILLLFYVGHKADGWLGTRGVFTAVGTILGVVGGAVVCYRQIMELTENDKKEEDGEDSDRSA